MLILMADIRSFDAVSLSGVLSASEVTIIIIYITLVPGSLSIVKFSWKLCRSVAV